MLQHLTGGITEALTLRSMEGSEQLGHYVENCFKKRALILTTAMKVIYHLVLVVRPTSS